MLLTNFSWSAAVALAYCAAECASALTGKRSRMSFQHLYRRGHVFWWRRIHRLSDSRTLDLRLSLRTYERSQAVSRGAALTAATGGVIRMLEGRIRAAAVKPTEEELQSLAKAAYDELLVELCTTQRSEPYNAEHHSAINHACVDYYDRLIRNGGHRSLDR